MLDLCDHAKETPAREDADGERPTARAGLLSVVAILWPPRSAVQAARIFDSPHIGTADWRDIDPIAGSVAAWITIVNKNSGDQSLRKDGRPAGWGASSTTEPTTRACRRLAAHFVA